MENKSGKRGWKGALKGVKSSFASRQFKMGGYSFAICLIALALVVVLNLVMGALPKSWTQLDITAKGLYTLDDQTKALAKNLNRDVTITYLVTTDNTDDTIKAYLDRYDALSDRITVKTVDPELFPGYAENYGGDVADGDLIVESDLRYKVISGADLFQSDQSDYYAYMSGADQSVEFVGETELTSALDFVTTDTLPILYQLTGHGETAVTDTWSGYLLRENIEVRELSLLSAGTVPEDCSVLWICSPTADYTEEEAAAILDYLYNGGALMLFSDYTENDMPNFDSVMAAYGLSREEGFVVEGNMNYTANNLAYYLLPDLGAHEITTPIADGGLLALVSLPQGIVQAGDVRSSVTVEPLLTTSTDSFSKVEGNAITTWEREEQDIGGAFDVAVAVTEDYGDVKTRIVWVTSSSILDDTFDNYVGGGDSDFVLNSIGWMCEHENSITVRSKDFSQEYLTVPTGTSSILGAVFCILVPLAALGIGFGIWLSRRKK